MDPLEVAIDRVGKQQARLALELGEAQADLSNSSDSAERQELKRIIRENQIGIEALAYALTFLRSVEEELCQG